MEKLLLVVEESFQISGRGVVVTPWPSPEAAALKKSGDVVQVRLVRPDSTSEVVEATFYLAHFNPGGFHFECVLCGMKREQVPPGTEIWLLDEA